METLTLNDGTQLDGTILPGGDGRTIYVYLTALTIAEGVGIFLNANRIRKITAMNHGTETVYEGYTEIRSVDCEYGNCNLVMRRPENAS